MDQVKFAEDTAFKKFEGKWSAEAYHIPSKVLKAVFHKFYFVHLSILLPQILLLLTPLFVPFVLF